MKKFLNNIRSAENPHVGSYFEMRSILELITFLFAVVFLKRKAIKDTMIMLALSVGIAFVLDFVVPFDFG